jgi:hypothetical protein
MKKAIIAVLVIFFSVTALFALESAAPPKRVKVIAQSCGPNALFMTVIDLDTNEIVILEYAIRFSKKSEYGLNFVTRTGMFADPQTQETVKGEDAPASSQ